MALNKLWLFADADESVYAHYYHEIRKNMAAGGVLEGYQEQILALKTQLEALEGKSKQGWLDRILGRS